MQGINAVVVGILLAALYNPVWINAIYNLVDFFIASGAFLLLNF
jgi:chromate transporter